MNWTERHETRYESDVDGKGYFVCSCCSFKIQVHPEFHYIAYGGKTVVHYGGNGGPEVGIVGIPQTPAGEESPSAT